MLISERYQLVGQAEPLVASTRQAARDLNTGDLVVVDMFEFDGPLLDRLEQRLHDLRERFLALSHPSLPSIVDLVIYDGAFCVIYTAFDGKSLQELSEGGQKWTSSVLKRIFRDILGALSHLHSLEAPLSHREVDAGSIYLVPGAAGEPARFVLRDLSSTIVAEGLSAPPAFAADLRRLATAVVGLVAEAGMNPEVALETIDIPRGLRRALYVSLKSEDDAEATVLAANQALEMSAKSTTAREMVEPSEAEEEVHVVINAPPGLERFSIDADEVAREGRTSLPLLESWAAWRGARIENVTHVGEASFEDLSAGIASDMEVSGFLPLGRFKSKLSGAETSVFRDGSGVVIIAANTNSYRMMTHFEGRQILGLSTRILEYEKRAESEFFVAGGSIRLDYKKQLERIGRASRKPLIMSGPEHARLVLAMEQMPVVAGFPIRVVAAISGAVLLLTLLLVWVLT